MSEPPITRYAESGDPESDFEGGDAQASPPSCASRADAHGDESRHAPHDASEPGLAARVRASFARQAFMHTLGAELAHVAPGAVTIELPCRPALAQQAGSLHAGAVTAIVDSACGYAALTTMPPDADVVSVEFKVNLLAPAGGERLRATGRVLRAGRTLVVCAGEVHARAPGGSETLVAVMQATMMAVRPRQLASG